MCTAPWRQLSAPLEIAPMTAFKSFLITDLTMCKCGATDRNFIIRLTTFNLIKLRITHQTILMALNIGVAIYIVSKLLSKYNINYECLVFRCWWVAVKKQVLIRFWSGIRKSINKPLTVIKIYLIRHGAELRRVPTVTKDHTVVWV